MPHAGGLYTGIHFTLAAVIWLCWSYVGGNFRRVLQRATVPKFNCFLSKKITYPIKCPVQTPYFKWAETNSINYLHVMYGVWINSKRLVKFGSATGLYPWLSREWRLWTSVDFDPELHLSRTKCINFYNLVYLIAPFPPLNLVRLPWNKDGSVNQFSRRSKLILVVLNSN